MNPDTGENDIPSTEPAEKKSPPVWIIIGILVALITLIALIFWFWPPKLPAVRSGTIKLWLRADTGVSANSEGRVSEWKDQSASAAHALQANLDNQPLLVHPSGLGGKPALRFNGNQDGVNGEFLQGTKQVDVPDAMTSFVVYNAYSATNRENVFWMIGVPGTTYGACRGDMITAGHAHFTLWAYDYDAPFIVPLNTYRIRTDVLNKDLDAVKVFDVSATTSNKFDFTIEKAESPEAGYYLGGLDIHDPARPYVATTRCFNGEIAELIVYQGALSESDRLAVQGYLEQKYSLAGR